ncbi:MAG: hypothetical protein KOO66_05230 [Bacteroidales bacterium]|nr:hypothetical protein [Bacteroidales bacterium]
MKIRILIIYFFILFTTVQCSKDFPQIPVGYELVYLRDYFGLDGCSWIFENENGEKYEAINSEDFSLYNNGKRYFLKYEPIYE